MPLTLTWQEIAIRLALSVLAGGLIGVDRGEHGRPAGLRTTLLVCLAAAVAMIQANALLATAGKPQSSFAVLDLMRLPLGILTGMGFIGGGAILRRDNLVVGVTTAATLWFVTVIGLCFGGGQLALGASATGLGIAIISGLRWLDRCMPQEHHAILSITSQSQDLGHEAIRLAAQKAGYEISIVSSAYLGREWRLQFRLQWHGTAKVAAQPEFLNRLVQDPQVLAAEWKMI
jgi:putative Mg2+ transporter-C (MgtC) family protein